MMKNLFLKKVLPVSLLLTAIGTANATGIGSDVTITAVQGDCQSTTGGHAHATAFFNKRLMKNVIATNNEFQSVGGVATSRDTDVHFDIWKGNYKIVGYRKDQGVIVRTGQLDVRSKFDIFVDLKKRFGYRQIVWNNFVGMPNPSGEMSMMRFERGQHFSCVNSGETQGSLQFQIFDVNGDFVGVTEGCDSAPKSVHVTPDVTTLDYYDLNGNPVDVSSAIGRGFVKMSGRPNAENGGNASPFTSAVAIYQTASTRHESWIPYWLDKNRQLHSSTITFARRNAGNDTLDLGQ